MGRQRSSTIMGVSRLYTVKGKESPKFKKGHRRLWAVSGLETVKGPGRQQSLRITVSQWVIDN